MASGGTGDVLTGIAGASSRVDWGWDAAAAAALLHGRRETSRPGRRGGALIASDVTAFLGPAFGLLRSRGRSDGRTDLPDEAATRRLAGSWPDGSGPERGAPLRRPRSGKTVFVRASRKARPRSGGVASPTFALVHEYGRRAGRRPPARDFYAFQTTRGHGVADLGLAAGGGAILAVEWPRPPLSEERAVRVTLEEFPAGAEDPDRGALRRAISRRRRSGLGDLAAAVPVGP